ncbi:unnamed protein product [Colias eurytheme]|nr:unnamed protein product [Colias eurytheme]
MNKAAASDTEIKEGASGAALALISESTKLPEFWTDLPRCSKVKKKWENMKKTVKDKVAGHRKHATGTGGGPPNPDLKMEPWEEEFLMHIKLTADLQYKEVTLKDIENPAIIKKHGEQSWLLGDSGYAQRRWLMTPILNAAPGSRDEVYTTRHVQARNCIERCFGLLKARWRCLLKHRTLHYEPHIVSACCVLHNIAVQARLPQPVYIVITLSTKILVTWDQIKPVRLIPATKKTLCKAGYYELA